MAYWRKLKSGDSVLVYSAKEKALRESRADNARPATEVGWIWRDPLRGQYRRRRHRDIADCMTYYNQYHGGRDGLLDTIQRLEQDVIKHRRRVAATLKAQRLGIWSSEVSPSGNVDYARSMLNSLQADLRYYEDVLRYYKNSYSFSYRRRS